MSLIRRYGKNEMKLKELPELVQKMIKNNHPEVVRIKAMLK